MTSPRRGCSTWGKSKSLSPHPARSRKIIFLKKKRLENRPWTKSHEISTGGESRSIDLPSPSSSRRKKAQEKKEEQASRQGIRVRGLIPGRCRAQMHLIRDESTHKRAYISGPSSPSYVFFSLLLPRHRRHHQTAGSSRACLALTDWSPSFLASSFCLSLRGHWTSRCHQKSRESLPASVTETPLERILWLWGEGRRTMQII